MMGKFPLKILKKVILKDLEDAPSSDNEEEPVDVDANGVGGKGLELMLVEKSTKNQDQEFEKQATPSRTEHGMEVREVLQAEEREVKDKEGNAQENGTQGVVVQMSGIQEVNESQAEDVMVEDDMAGDEMAEENIDDPEERDGDEDYFPEEDEFGSEEEGPSSSDSSDEEYTPNSIKTVKPPKRKLVEMAQPLFQEEEPSEYEKIRANNIKQREALLRELQDGWLEYMESEGLEVSKSRKGRKKLKVVEREELNTRRVQHPAENIVIEDQQKQGMGTSGTGLDNESIRILWSTIFSYYTVVLICI